jgi:mgtE-like transporter
MHLGIITPAIAPQGSVTVHFAQAYLFTLLLMPLMAALAHLAALVLDVSSPGLLAMVTIATAAGLGVITMVNGIAYLTATLSFRYGFDPDNFGIPVITSAIDLLGAVALITVIEIVL